MPKTKIVQIYELIKSAKMFILIGGLIIKTHLY